ncbi:MAG: nucleotide exchange factor GrpE [Patescibacteria group bacterium]
MAEEKDLEFVEETEDGSELTGEQAVKKLREKLELSQSERQEFLETSQRLRADYVNLKRETESSQIELIKFANQKLLLDLLGLADNFELAFANKNAWEQAPPEWRQGVEQIYQKLRELFKQYQLEEIAALNQPFDPEQHQALATLDTDNPEQDNTVAEVIQKGYKLHSKIIRPAGVKIYQVKLAK